jgi:hypothetical protein
VAKGEDILRLLSIDQFFNGGVFKEERRLQLVSSVIAS